MNIYIARNSVQMLKSVEEDVMIDGIERGWQIKESYKSYITIAQSTHDVIHNFEKGRFGPVSWTVGRLRGREEIVGGEIDRQLREGDFFQWFWTKMMLGLIIRLKWVT